MMSDDDKRPACRYGSLCYRKNPDHHKHFKHPSKRSVEQEQNEVKKQKRSQDADSDTADDKTRAVAEESTEVDGSSASPDEDSSSQEEPLPASPEDVKLSIKQKFLVEMPDDFFSFWEFCKSLNAEKPEEALLDTGLRLVGAFDVLSGKLKCVKRRLPDTYLRHWRYYYDPPEFQTVLKGDDASGFHIGYFRDRPSDSPAFLVSNSVATNNIFKPVGANIFEAVCGYISETLKTLDPFKQLKVKKIEKSLNNWAEKEGYNKDNVRAAVARRKREVVASTFHGLGIVVPYDKKTELGYRSIPETTSNLKRMFKRIVEAKSDEERQKHLDTLQDQVLVNVHFANDEGDPGMGLELGLDMFSFGGESLHNNVLDTLVVAYDLLQRQEFALILKAHLKDRRKGSDLSIV